MNSSSDKVQDLIHGPTSFSLSSVYTFLKSPDIIFQNILGTRASTDEHLRLFSTCLSQLNSELTGSPDSESNNLNSDELWNYIESISDTEKFSSEVKSLLQSQPSRVTAAKRLALFHTPFLSLLPDDDHTSSDDEASLPSEDSEASEEDAEDEESDEEEDLSSEGESASEASDKQASQIFYSDMYGDEPPAEYHSTDEEAEAEAEAAGDMEEDEAAAKQPPQSVDEAEALLRMDRTPLTAPADEAGLSSFERLQRKLCEEMVSQERERVASMLGEKRWQLRGEVSSNERPLNSLLEEPLQFDQARAPPPVYKPEDTNELEQHIRQRIKDRAFDDVERKVKPVDQVFEYRKQAPLNTERSKEGLAELYERELLAGANAALSAPAADEREREHAATILGGGAAASATAAPFTGSSLFSNPSADEARRVAIRTRLDALFSQLDALSQLHFTPKLMTASEDTLVSVLKSHRKEAAENKGTEAARTAASVSVLPASLLEDTGPVLATAQSLLAPEEIAPRKAARMLKDRTERSREDKRHDRRLLKIRRKRVAKEREERSSAQAASEAPAAPPKPNLVALSRAVSNALSNANSAFSGLKLKNGERVSAGARDAGERKGKQRAHSGQQRQRGGRAGPGANLSSSSQFFSALSASVERHRSHPHKRPFGASVSASVSASASASGGQNRKRRR